ncbi:MAG: FAD-binding protein [Kiritimatiellae bacterium]|nr:FAD-binding protein [Kiritimatiellia bacterium]
MSIPLFQHHTLVIGSGAAGLNAAVQLRSRGIEDVIIVTEGLDMGTSINTGSDKQTYYKLSMYGEDADSPALMAQTYFDGGSMHGDLALVEAGLSARAFLNLVNLGVPFPTDEYGQFIGYKTDHDPRQRATSIGPYTSREMCRALIRQIKRLNIPVKENRTAVRLIVQDEGSSKRICGAVVINADSTLEVYTAENVVLAVGGPGGLYKTSVYPSVHTGAIGLGLMAGAKAQNLPESQYGMASIKFRWNVSGTYMQVIPRFISTAEDGSGEREFLRDYFDSVGEMNSQIFLKGYQWPFDSRKVIGGSSIVDILVYIESVTRGRRVFMDFRGNPDGFSFDDLSSEAREYLTNSNALLETPIERLRTMNPGAIALYKDNGIDIAMEPLEIAVCAQHNNGGLAANHWWESLNIKHLFPVGEVNGSHGLYRPGGSALNSGQVASIRAAEFIANRYAGSTLSSTTIKDTIKETLSEILAWTAKCTDAPSSWQEERVQLQTRMTTAGAHIRSVPLLETAAADAWRQYNRLNEGGCSSPENELHEPLRNLYLCFAHATYLEAVLFALISGVGSRGSAIALAADGRHVHDKLDDTWRIAGENEEFRDQVMETIAESDGTVTSRWVPRRPIPEMDAWFETAWARYREGKIYD